MKKKKKDQRIPNELELGIHKLANFTSKSLNRAYKDFKNKQKKKEKKELKLREEQIKKNKKS